MSRYKNFSYQAQHALQTNLNDHMKYPFSFFKILTITMRLLEPDRHEPNPISNFPSLNTSTVYTSSREVIWNSNPINDSDYMHACIVVEKHRM